LEWVKDKKNQLLRISLSYDSEDNIKSYEILGFASFTVSPLITHTIGCMQPDHKKNFWYLKKITIVPRINYEVDFKPALERCDMSSCPLWDDGFCVHLDIRDAGQ
jgi:hypothetical protein